MKNQLEEQKIKLKKSENQYVESKENALNFNRPEATIQSATKSAKPTGMRKFPTEQPVQQKQQVNYQLNGNILDLARNRPIQSEAVRTSAKPSKNEGTILTDYNVIQMKYMNAYYPTQDQILDSYKSTSTERIKSSISAKSSISLEEVPQNIKHRFRTKQTNELMKDQTKVNETIMQLQNIEDAKKYKYNRDETNHARPVSATVDPKQNAFYYDLSNYLRHTICHGYPDLKKRSFKEHVHNDSVNKEYLSDPTNYNLQNRRKKDWLGK